MRPALSMKWTTSSRRFASWAKIASAFVLSSAIVRFWLPRMLSTCLSCWRAGAPARIAALRFSALLSSAVPNSLISSWSRSRNGSRSVFWARSGWTVVLLRAAGIGPFRGCVEVPGWQSRKYSAISDCGSEEQLASALNSGKLESSSTVTSAVFCGVISRSVMLPALAPATRSSEPLTRPKALKSSTL